MPMYCYLYTDLQMNIDPGLHATQLQLKKNKLADQLNDKIANRPGPLQLLKEGILNPTLREMVKEIEFEPPETAAEAKGKVSKITETFYDEERRVILSHRHSFPGALPVSRGQSSKGHDLTTIK